LDKLIKNPLPFPSIVKIIFTAHVAIFAIVFFRADDIQHGFLYFERLLAFDFNNLYGLKSLVNYTLYVPFLLLVDWKLGLDSFSEFIDKFRSQYLRKLIYGSLILLIVHLGVFYGQSFIYFQF